MLLNLPTLFIVYVGNLTAIGLVWACLLGRYPDFVAARFWTAAAFIAGAGAATSLLRGVANPLIPILLGNGLLILAVSLVAMGVERFYHRRPSWRIATATVVSGLAGLALFSIWRDDMPIRVVIHSCCQSIPIVLMLRVMQSQRERSVGGRVFCMMLFLSLALYVIRSVVALLGIGGPLSVTNLNPLQTALVVALMLVATLCNFGGLLMAIDRLRSEVADLALLDDLTGVANRRHLFQRLNQECARSAASGEPFALLAIDLDGFKAINDSFGHGAGDECLRNFTLIAQRRLRPGDLLARVGGDEFCIVLPATTLREGAMIARQVLESCREQSESGRDIALSASIGVAQWRPEMGLFPEQLVVAADHALYTAKNGGKNRFAVSEPAPAPVTPAMVPLLKSA
jgi:diguanylate cyclase (GGDEF)-like protein